MTALGDLLAEAVFPLFAIHPRHWSGRAFVGSFGRGRVPEPWLHDLQLTYESEDAASQTAVVVSNVDADLITGVRGIRVEPVGTHLTNFVARFDQRFVVGRLKGRSFEPFPRADFDVRSTVVAVAGESLGAEVLVHTELPLQLARAVVRRGAAATELGVGTWRLPVLDLVPLVEQVTPALARDFDAPRGDVYPPPEWGVPPEG